MGFHRQIRYVYFSSVETTPTDDIEVHVHGIWALRFISAVQLSAEPLYHGTALQVLGSGLNVYFDMDLTQVFKQ